MNIAIVRRKNRNIQDTESQYAVITSANSRNELNAELEGEGREVEAFFALDGQLADLLEILATNNEEQENSFAQQIEDLLSQVYLRGYGRYVDSQLMSGQDNAGDHGNSGGGRYERSLIPIYR